jgi:hypothetical protein
VLTDQEAITSIRLATPRARAEHGEGIGDQHAADSGEDAADAREHISGAALADLLNSGHVAGAAFDVFSVEPATENPLFGLTHLRKRP